jgi:hypothetical protein
VIEDTASSGVSASSYKLQRLIELSSLLAERVVMWDGLGRARHRSCGITGARPLLFVVSIGARMNGKAKPKNSLTH